MVLKNIQKAGNQSFYQILEVGITLEADSPEFLELFDRDYGWFRTAAIKTVKQLSCTIRLKEGTKAQRHKGTKAETPHKNNKNSCTIGDKRKNGPCVRINSQLFSLQGHPDKCAYAYQIILRKIYSQIKNFLLLHAGVVTKHDKALIIAGSPGIGKTTMVRELLAGGFGFFSDDVCPIHKKTKLLHPFPRSLWVHNTANTSKERTYLREKKSPIDPVPLLSKENSRPCKIKCVICLEASDEADTTRCALEIGLKESVHEFFQDLEQLPKVTLERIHPQFLDFRLSYPKGLGLTKKVKELLQKHKEYIWNVYQVTLKTSNFDKAPRLTQISNHEAAFFLMQDLKQGLVHQGNARVSPGRFFMEVNALLDHVPCYRLSVGRLQEMKKLVASFIYAQK